MAVTKEVWIWHSRSHQFWVLAWPQTPNEVHYRHILACFLFFFGSFILPKSYQMYVFLLFLGCKTTFKTLPDEKPVRTHDMVYHKYLIRILKIRDWMCQIARQHERLCMLTRLGPIKPLKVNYFNKTWHLWRIDKNELPKLVYFKVAVMSLRKNRTIWLFWRFI